MWCRVTLRRLSSYCIAKRTRPHNEPAEEMNSRNKFLELIVAPSNYSRVFFHSLLNSALSYDPVGWGIPYLSSLSLSLSPSPTVNTSLPLLIHFRYNHVLFRDTKEPLTIASLHFLILCCTYPPSRYRVWAIQLKSTIAFTDIV